MMQTTESGDRRNLARPKVILRQTFDAVYLSPIPDESDLLVIANIILRAGVLGDARCEGTRGPATHLIRLR